MTIQANFGALSISVAVSTVPGQSIFCQICKKKTESKIPRHKYPLLRQQHTVCTVPDTTSRSPLGDWQYKLNATISLLGK